MLPVQRWCRNTEGGGGLNSISPLEPLKNLKVFCWVFWGIDRAFRILQLKKLIIRVCWQIFRKFYQNLNFRKKSKFWFFQKMGRNSKLQKNNSMLRRCLLVDTWANHMARSRGTLVAHLVRISYSTTLLAIVHMYREYYMFTLGSQRTKEVFHNWLKYFVFVYQRAHSYEERMHVPLRY